MKRHFAILLIIAIVTASLLLGSCLPVAPSTTMTTPPVTTTSTTATTPPAPTPALFIRDRDESLPPGAVKMTPETDVHPPILHSDEWEQPVPLPYPVSTAGGEDSPFIMPDGRTLYFWFTPDVSVPPQQQLHDGVTGIYVTMLNDDGSWTSPERLILNDDISLDGAAFVQDDIIWFASVRPGYTGMPWFTAEYKDGLWQNWKHVEEFPAHFEVGELHVSADWTELYYHSARPGGKGGYDIWYTHKVEGVWQEPVNVEAVNTPETDGWPYLGRDGRELWFLRTWQSSPSIFRALLVGGKWAEPELIISQFAGEPTLDDAGNLYFVHHYFKDGVMLEADIYVARKK